MSATHKYLSHSKNFNIAMVVLATVVATGLRLLYVTKSSIWHDEGFSILLARRTPDLIWSGSARDVHPPLYYELLHIWMKYFGDSVFTIRSLSVVVGILLVPLGYLFVKKVANNRAAIITAFLLACAPFLIRYSQEARMYGLLSLFTLLAVYAATYIAEKPKNFWPYILYCLAITAGMYTHYFTALAIMSIWLYFVVLQPIKKIRFGKSIVVSARWWLANAVALILFIPWLPNMIAQLRRGQGLSWLPKTTIMTYHDTIWQFFTFTDAHKIFYLIYLLVPIIILIASIYLIYTDKSAQKYSRLVVSFGILPILVGLLVSIQKPIFHERYFVFAAVAIYIIVAMAIDRFSQKRIWLLGILLTLVVGTELIGVRNVYAQSGHKIGEVVGQINNQYQIGDKIVAAELYVYFDSSYYNTTAQPIKIYTANSNLNGYGESGLLYDQNVYIDSYNNIPKGRVWIVGKTGEHDYYRQIPSTWVLLSQAESGYSKVRLYQVK